MATTGTPFNDPQPRPPANGSRRSRLPLVVLAVVVVLVVVVATAFSVAGGGAPEAVRIGAIYPLTGPDADAGNDAYRGVRFAVEYVNGGDDPESPVALGAGGGLPRLDGAKLKLVAADSRSDRCRGQAAFNELVDPGGVAAVVGAYESTVTLQALIAADRRHVPLVSESASAPSLTERGPGAQPTINACNIEPDPRPSTWFFRVGISDMQAAERFFAFIKEAEDSGTIRRIRKVAILRENNDIFGNGGAAAIRRLAKRLTVQDFPYRTVLGPSASLLDSACTVKEHQLVVTLRSRVRQIRQYHPDIVFALSYTPDAISAVQAMQELDYVPPALLTFGGGFLDSTFIRGVRAGNPACGLPAANPAGIVARGAWSSDVSSQSRSARHIAQLYRRRYKRPMTGNAAAGFTAVLTLARAINDAGSTDSTKIQAALRELDVPADATIMPWAGVKFDDNGQNVRAQVVLQQVIEGRYQVVYPNGRARAVWPLAKARRQHR